jgi:hypothetical protein
MLNTMFAPLAPRRWPAVSRGFGWSPEPPSPGCLRTGRQERQPEVVHGTKPGDVYLRLPVHRHHAWSRLLRYALHLLAGACPMP